MDLTLFISIAAILFSVTAIVMVKIAYDDQAEFLRSRGDFYLKIEHRIRHLEGLYERQANTISTLMIAQQEAPHGLKKDGTPKAKPGRKAK